MWPFSSRPHSRQTTPATGGIAAHSPRRVSVSKGSIYKGVKITPAAEGFIALDSVFDTSKDAKRFIDTWQKRHQNPGAFQRCVEELKRGGGVIGNPADTQPLVVLMKDGKRWRKVGSYVSQIWATAALKQFRADYPDRTFKLQSRKSNPAAGADEMTERFHGRPVQELIEVEEEVHYHEHLAELGVLTKLKVKAPDGAIVILSDFKDAEGNGALLCSNEDGSQLYIRGGDQSVPLSEFEIDQPHDKEDLGSVVRIWYHTVKDHLGEEGGDATYFHDFGEEDAADGYKPRRPRLMYSVRDERLSFSGGAYRVEREGIVN